MALLPRRSRFVLGAIVFSPHWPVRAWIPENSSVGSSNTSASGIMVGYRVRGDKTLRMVLRVRESEWSDFDEFIDAAQMGDTFEWFPEADEAESFECYLESPKMGDKLTPTRDGEYPRVFEVGITIRGAGDVVPWLEFFDG